MTAPKRTQKLYFIRHGLAELNVAGLYAGITETPLTPEGRKQAKLAGKEAKDLGLDYIISSPLSRALHTAQIIAEEIGYPVNKIHVDAVFMERDFGDLEAQPYNPTSDYSTVNNLETDDMLKKRARKALEFIESLEAQNILIVSHGSFGRALRFHLQPESSFEEKLLNAQLHHWR